jgi:non-ribosomal peptide synthetase component F
LLAEDGLQFNYPPYQEEAIKSAAYKNAADYELDGDYWKAKFPQKPLRLLQKRYPELDSSGKSSSTCILNLSNTQRKFLEDLQLVTKSGLQQLTIAALTIYFAKTTGQSELLFGIPLHKRNSKKLRSIIGMFSGILPYKGSFQKGVKLGDLLKEISATQRGDYRHQNYLIGDLAKHLKINSYDGYLCEVIINYEPLNFELQFGNDIEATIYRIANEFDLNPLQLSWRDYASEQPLQLHIHFRNEYFSQNETELLAQRLMFILEQFPDKMDQDIESIRILPGTEKELLAAFNITATDYPKDKTIVELFEEQVLKTPEAAAVVFEGSQLTYKELNEKANRLAHYLRHKGVKEETLVPICIERSP